MAEPTMEEMMERGYKARHEDKKAEPKYIFADKWTTRNLFKVAHLLARQYAIGLDVSDDQIYRSAVEIMSAERYTANHRNLWLATSRKPQAGSNSSWPSHTPTQTIITEFEREVIKQEQEG